VCVCVCVYLRRVCVCTCDQVVDVLEGAGGLAVAVDRHVFSLQCLRVCVCVCVCVCVSELT
jgi:hypothetical protein